MPVAGISVSCVVLTFSKAFDGLVSYIVVGAGLGTLISSLVVFVIAIGWHVYSGIDPQATRKK